MTHFKKPFLSIFRADKFLTLSVEDPISDANFFVKNQKVTTKLAAELLSRELEHILSHTP